MGTDKPNTSTSDKNKVDNLGIGIAEGEKVNKLGIGIANINKANKLCIINTYEADNLGSININEQTN